MRRLKIKPKKATAPGVSTDAHGKHTVKYGKASEVLKTLYEKSQQSDGEQAEKAKHAIEETARHEAEEARRRADQFKKDVEQVKKNAQCALQERQTAVREQFLVSTVSAMSGDALMRLENITYELTRPRTPTPQDQLASRNKSCFWSGKERSAFTMMTIEEYKTEIRAQEHQLNFAALPKL